MSASRTAATSASPGARAGTASRATRPSRAGAAERDARRRGARLSMYTVTGGRRRAAPRAAGSSPGSRSRRRPGGRRARRRVDRVAPPGTRDRGGVTRLGGAAHSDAAPSGRAPRSRRRARARGIDAPRRERADRGATPVRRAGTRCRSTSARRAREPGRREQEADARRGKVDGETFELGAGQRDAQQTRARRSPSAAP